MALGLGGNLGPAWDIEATLRRALERLEANLGGLRTASLYRSGAVSSIPQPDYLNTAAVGCTALTPEAVLAIAKALELAAGRRLGPRNAARPLDIDLLFYGDLRSTAPEMTLPHPRLAERRFVLAPLAEIAPDAAVPPSGASAAELLRRLTPATPGVERLDWGRPPGAVTGLLGPGFDPGLAGG